MQYLCMNDMKNANIVYKEFIGQAQLDTPLVHYLMFLLKTCERQAAPLFQTLNAKYSIALSRDASLQKYIAKIGSIYFGIQPATGFLENLLAMGGMGGM